MPVLKKEKLEKLHSELRNRYAILTDSIAGRELRSGSEGCRRGSWSQPDGLQATEGSELDIHLAIDDFKTILAEIRKLK